MILGVTLKFLNNDVFVSLKIGFILANSAIPNKSISSLVSLLAKVQVSRMKQA